MKKILFAAPLLALLFTACDPAVDEVERDANVTTEELTDGFTITAKSEGNNNLTFHVNPVRYVKVYDASTDACVAMGTAPTCQIVPPARSIDFYVTTMNQDGTITKSGTKNVNVSEFTDLPAIFNDIFGDGNGGFTTTTWTWDDTLSRYWGNAGWGSDTGPGWWGAPDQADINEQAAGKGMPDDGVGAWFSLNLSGVNTSRGETGTVTVTTDQAVAGWGVGTMTFNGTVPLLGVLPNDGNQRCYAYQIIKADGDHLVLAAPSSNGWEGWFFCYKRIPNK